MVKERIALLFLLSCAAEDYSVPRDNPPSKCPSISCPDLECNGTQCPDCTCKCDSCPMCPACPGSSCTKCPDCPSSSGGAFYVHDCECLSADGIYYCNSLACARDEYEANVFGKMVCDIMFLAYGVEGGDCTCENLYDEECK